ncbi:MAG: undecaprenyl-diphosphate phosphatase [Ruminococcaceae bacterium]|nr:undecaprenyl-diphosphate phosphatase [Oscillospiraceae bacterium]
MNWLQCLLYGFVSGAAEFLPISAEAHRGLLRIMFGTEASPLLELVIHIAVLAALIIACWPQLARLQRERHLAAIPPKRRRRQPDLDTLKNFRLLKTAAAPMLIAFVFWFLTRKAASSLLIMAVLLTVNGILLYTPAFVPQGNKAAAKVSGLDGFLIGLGGALGVIPGISRVSGITMVGIHRGCDRRYILDVALLLSVPALVVLIVWDIILLILAGAAVSGGLLLGCFLALAAALPTAYLSIIFLRFLAVKVGFSGFAYYNWGAAMFAFILYLTI